MVGKFYYPVLNFPVTFAYLVGESRLIRRDFLIIASYLLTYLLTYLLMKFLLINIYGSCKLIFY